MLEPIITRKNHTLSSRHCSERLGIAACNGGGSERLGIAACHLLELLLLSRSIIVCQSTVAASGTRFLRLSSPSGVEPDAKAILI